MSVSLISRREFALAAIGQIFEPGSLNQLTPLRDLIQDSMLRRFYDHEPHHISNDGGVGINYLNFQIIEEQRQGADFITCGIVSGRPDWIGTGWRVIDFGLEHQVADGGFGNYGAFHSTSLFVEGLARACTLDPNGANARRVAALEAATDWLLRSHPRGRKESAPYTHRRYILAAALGLSGALTRNRRAKRAAQAWAHEGLSMQRTSGINPEAGGFDVSYQIVGVLFACRYMTACDDEDLRQRLKSMVARALDWEGTRLSADGSIDPTGSARIGHERWGSNVKSMNYSEAYQAIVYASQIVSPRYRAMARSIGSRFGWI